jgi:hypothetical protein
MRKMIPVCLLLIAFFVSCRKENETLITGTVISPGGCFQDSWLVAIDNPDFSDHPFLRPTVLSCAPCYNCSNSVFIRLTGTLGSPGTRIRFAYHESVPSCLSSSEAPEHIRVRHLSGL